MQNKKNLLEYEALLKKELEIREGLPHLHGWKWYKWAREFFEGTNRMNFLVAGNQLSKSSTQIRKCIDWATDTKKWPLLWRTKPVQFWYLYPTKDVATNEFEMKWVKEFMPRGSYKDHPQYGWEETYKDRELHSVAFNSGVTVFFKTYAQSVQHLQTATAHAIFCDEELPEELFPELQFRLAATDGYFSMVFTATLGQELWRRTMEERGGQEMFPHAAKWSVSAYDCIAYDDGTKSPWTLERIHRMENNCKSEAEILKRVRGRFVVDGGLKYGGFSRAKNMLHELPRITPEWHLYSGVDIGSGGAKGHPAAICFLAVSPDYSMGVVYKAWRGDGVDTTSADILNKYIGLRGTQRMTAQYYDWQSKDFFTFASRVGEAFIPAEKSQALGEDTLNVLFKNKMLFLMSGDEEIEKLAVELGSVKKSTAKPVAADDLCDGLRFASTKVPWDMTKISDKPLEESMEVRELTGMDLRRGRFAGMEAIVGGVEEEFEEWNAQYNA